MGRDLETLENDAAALRVLVRLLDHGTLVDALSDACDGTEEDTAVAAWLRERLEETENAIAALTGGGPPISALDALQAARATVELCLSADLSEIETQAVRDAADALSSVLPYDVSR